MLKYSRFAARAVAMIISVLQQEAQVVGATGKQLEQIAVCLMKKNKLKSSSLNYGGFPAAICVSVNNELTHGIPTTVPFEAGDLVSVDVACSYRGFHADAAMTFIVREQPNQSGCQQKLLSVTEGALMAAINSIIPGVTTTSQLGAVVEAYAKERGVFVIKQFGGHGIGQKLHMDPFIPNFATGSMELIKPGMLLCIEPLIQVTNDLIKVSANGMTIESLDGSLNAHFEHTVLIGPKNVEILTTTNNIDNAFYQHWKG